MNLSYSSWNQIDLLLINLVQVNSLDVFIVFEDDTHKLLIFIEFFQVLVRSCRIQTVSLLERRFIFSLLSAYMGVREFLIKVIENIILIVV